MNMKMNTNGALSCGVGKIVLVELSISDKLLMLCLCYFFRGSVVSGEFPVGVVLQGAWPLGETGGAMTSWWDFWWRWLADYR